MRSLCVFLAWFLHRGRLVLYENISWCFIITKWSSFESGARYNEGRGGITDQVGENGLSLLQTLERTFVPG